MPAPDYDAMNSYKPYSEASGSDEEDAAPKLSNTLMMLADKLGYDEEKAQALHDFIKECVADEESGEYDDSEE